jgi:hypothetical protein
VRRRPSYRGPAPSPVIWPPSACPPDLPTSRYRESLSARGIDSVDLYVRPDADQLRQLAADAADGRLGLDVEAVRLEDAALIAQRVTAGRSGGTKYALLPS